MAFGTLAHTVGKRPLQELTRVLGFYDIDFVQLALSKAIEDIDTGLGKLSPGLASHIAEQFAKQGIRIGVLGCYINPVHPDPAQRRHEIDRFKEHIRFARNLGAPMVATETGALTTFIEQEPERYVEKGWQVLRETVEELVEEAEKWGVYVGLEPVKVHTLTTPERMRQLLDEVPSSNIGVVLDPVNLLNEENVGQQEQIVEQAFSLFGDRIILAHLKDISYQDGQLKASKPGSGFFNIAGFLEKLNKHKPYIDISIEAIKEQDIDEAVRFVKQLSKY